MVDEKLSFFVLDENNEVIGEFTSGVSEYEHEHVEGPYRASWVFKNTEEVEVSESALRFWFYNRMMAKVEVRYSGVPVWRGWVWEMELEMGKILQRRTMEDFANAIACTHSEDVNDGYVDFHNVNEIPGRKPDPDDDRFILNQASIDLYGRMETVLSSSGSDGEALEYALAALQRLPDMNYYEIVPVSLVEEPSLRITAVGNMVVANKIVLFGDKLRHHDDYDEYNWGDPPEDPALTFTWTVSDEIRRIVETVESIGGWLHVIKIADNDTETRIGTSTEQGAFDRLRELAQLRDSEGNWFELRVTPDGGVTYEKIVMEASYILTTYEEGVLNPDGTLPTWDARPGLIEMVGGTLGPNQPNSWLSEGRFIPIERTSMRDGDETASFHRREVSVMDEYAAMQANIRWMNG